MINRNKNSAVARARAEMKQAVKFKSLYVRM